MLWLTVSRPVRLGIKHPSGTYDQFFFPFGIRNTSESYVLDSVGRPLWREDGSVFCMCRWSLPAQSFSCPSPLGLATVFYCLRFETSLSLLKHILRKVWFYTFYTLCATQKVTLSKVTNFLLDVYCTGAATSFNLIYILKLFCSLVCSFYVSFYFMPLRLSF
jgi:hypothetical protein